MSELKQGVRIEAECLNWNKSKEDEAAELKQTERLSTNKRMSN